MSNKKVLYKHVNSAALQAAENTSEITLHYLTGQAKMGTGIEKSPQPRTGDYIKRQPRRQVAGLTDI
jgi:hypothetical protein